MIRTSTFALPPGLVAVAWLALAVPPAFAADEAAEEADAHILQAEIALQRDEYKTASTEYREAAKASADAEGARQATQGCYTYGLPDVALASAGRWRELARAHRVPRGGQGERRCRGRPAGDPGLLHLRLPRRRPRVREALVRARPGERRGAPLPRPAPAPQRRAAQRPQELPGAALAGRRPRR